MKLIKILDVKTSHNNDLNCDYLKEENGNYIFLNNKKEFMYGFKSYNNEKVATNAYNKQLKRNNCEEVNKCPNCGNYTIPSNIYQYVDESNCAITNNSPQFCCQCPDFNSMKY